MVFLKIAIWQKNRPRNIVVSPLSHPAMPTRQLEPLWKQVTDDTSLHELAMLANATTASDGELQDLVSPNDNSSSSDSSSESSSSIDPGDNGENPDDEAVASEPQAEASQPQAEAKDQHLVEAEDFADLAGDGDAFMSESETESEDGPAEVEGAYNVRDYVAPENRYPRPPGPLTPEPRGQSLAIREPMTPVGAFSPMTPPLPAGTFANPIMYIAPTTPDSEMPEIPSPESQ